MTNTELFLINTERLVELINWAHIEGIELSNARVSTKTAAISYSDGPDSVEVYINPEPNSKFKLIIKVRQDKTLTIDESYVLDSTDHAISRLSYLLLRS